MRNHETMQKVRSLGLFSLVAFLGVVSCACGSSMHPPAVNAGSFLATAGPQATVPLTYAEERERRMQELRKECVRYKVLLDEAARTGRSIRRWDGADDVLSFDEWSYPVRKSRGRVGRQLLGL